MQACPQPINNSSQQQYSNLRVTNGAQVPSQVIRPNGQQINVPPRVTHQVNLRQMTANTSQVQYPMQSAGNIPQHSAPIQQPAAIQQSASIQQPVSIQQPASIQQPSLMQSQSNQSLQSPMNQWEHRPRISLQTSQHSQNPRASVPLRQPFTMQMRPSSQTIIQAPQVSMMKQRKNRSFVTNKAGKTNSYINIYF